MSIAAYITENGWYFMITDKTPADIRNGFISKFSNLSMKRLVVNMTTSGWISYYLPKEAADWLKEK